MELRTFGYLAAALVVLFAPYRIDAQTKKYVITKKEAKRLLEQEKEKAFRHILPRSARLKRYLAGYRVVVSKHYVIFTNGPVTTKKFKISLEKLYNFVRKYYPYVNETKPLKCYIFKSTEEYYNYSEKIRHFKGARATAGHATSEYYATFYQSPTAAVVFHEATHQIVMGVCDVWSGGSWFQEGTAVFIERLMTGLNPSAGQKSKVRYDRYYPLSRLADIPSLLSDGNNGERNYAQAGSIVDFMVRGRFKKQFPKYMEYLRKHPGSRGAKGAAESVKAVYDMTLEEFDREWMKYVGFKGRKK